MGENMAEEKRKKETGRKFNPHMFYNDAKAILDTATMDLDPLTKIELYDRLNKAALAFAVHFHESL